MKLTLLELQGEKYDSSNRCKWPTGTELRHLLDERNEEYVAVDVQKWTSQMLKSRRSFCGSKTNLGLSLCCLHCC